jgi:hypothetical protein
VSTDREPMQRPLTMNETAEVFGVSKRWLQQQSWLEGIPYLRCGHKRLFDEVALNAVREAMRNKCLTNSSPRSLGARRTGTLGALSSKSIVTEALKLATSGKRRR